MQQIAEDESHADETGVVDLNVGGVKYSVALSTLVSVPSMLAEMFSGRHASVKRREKDGRVFIDRDGKLFRHVLQFLRDHDIAETLAMMHPEKLQRLKKEASFFCMESLGDHIDEFTRHQTKEEKQRLSDVRGQVHSPVFVRLGLATSFNGSQYWEINSMRSSNFPALDRLNKLAPTAYKWTEAIQTVLDVFYESGYIVHISRHRAAKASGCGVTHDFVFHPLPDRCSRIGTPFSVRAWPPMQ